jgi:hypothetical protein
MNFILFISHANHLGEIEADRTNYFSKGIGMVRGRAMFLRLDVLFLGYKSHPNDLTLSSSLLQLRNFYLMGEF